MKFTYFHLMPYDRLPEDFAEKNRSVWVDIPAGLIDSRRMHTLYNQYLDQIEYAAASGFDAVGVNEHHSNGYGMMSSPNMMGAAVMRRILHTAAKLLIMGDAVPLYNPPVRIAEELAMLDVISGGRLIAGFPIGSSMDTNYVYGVNPVTMRDQWLEGLDLVLRAWTETEVFAHNGRFTKLRYVNALPKPLQTPHPPVWLPGSGSVETMQLAIDRELPYHFLSYFGADFARRFFKMFWELVEAAGQEYNPYRTGIVQMVMVADSDEEARRLYEPHIRYFFQRCQHIYPGFSEAPGYKSVESLRLVLPKPGATSASRPDSFVAAKSYDWDQLIETGVVIGGGPDTVRERLESLGRECGIGNWITLMHIGDMPHEVALNNIDLFTRKVMPSLADVHAGKEHRWWPREIEGLERVDEQVVA